VRQRLRMCFRTNFAAAVFAQVEGKMPEQKEGEMGEELSNYGMGWLPDYPDFRDYTPEHETIRPLLEKTAIAAAGQKIQLPSSEDLRIWCSPIEDQGSLGSCTAHAGVGLVEYFERRAFGRHIGASRLFLYKATRNLAQLTGDKGL